MLLLVMVVVLLIHRWDRVGRVTNLSVHQPARHQYRLVHGIDCLDKLLHGVEDALVRELLVVMPGDPSQAVPVVFYVARHVCVSVHFVWILTGQRGVDSSLLSWVCFNLVYFWCCTCCRIG
uniref:(northern house mosquito) hypothetical protein n=1 Tax=Culex pipiens TaxID=7175 RepID=A0A8D8KDD5_CULPI